MSTHMTQAFNAIAARNRRETALATLDNAKQQRQDLQREFTRQITAARTHKDANLNSDGLRKKRDERAAIVRAEASKALTHFEQTVTSAVHTLEQNAEDVRPAVKWTAPADVARAQVKWDQTRMRLEAGVPLRNVVTTADLESVIALREWGPAWIEAERANTPRGVTSVYENPDLSGYMRALDQRTIELSPGTVANTLEAEREAHAVAAYLAPLVKHLRRDVEGHLHNATDLGAAVEATEAEQAARSQWPAAQDSDA